MRLLAINPNTDPEVTARVVAALRPFLPAGAEITGATGAFGAPYIVTRAGYAVGGHAALEAFARHAGEPFDACLLACFGDPGLMALREVAAIPVIGMAEASCQAAAAEPGRFAIVTGGAGWRAMLSEFVGGLGLSDRLSGIRTTTLSAGDMMRAPDEARASLVREIEACAAEGAERVILGGAGLAGFAGALRAMTPVPIVDCVEALARAALAGKPGQGVAAAQGPRPSPEAAALRRAGWL